MDPLKSALSNKFLKEEINGTTEPNARCESDQAIEAKEVKCDKVDEEDVNQLLLKPYKRFRDSMSKEFPENLIKAFNLWLCVPKIQMKVIIDVADKVYHTNLLLNAVHDSSELSSSLSSSHAAFGVAQAINVIRYSYFEAAHEINKLNNQNLSQAFTDGLLAFLSAQAVEMQWSGSLKCPTEKEFIDVVSQKIRGQLYMIVRLMQIESGSEIDYEGIAHKIGVYLEILSDYLDLKSVEYAHGNMYSDCLKTGKISFPIVHSINADPNSGQELIEIPLEHKSDTIESNQRAFDILERTNSFKYCLEYLNNLEADIRKMIQDHGNNSLLDEVIDGYIAFIK